MKKLLVLLLAVTSFTAGFSQTIYLDGKAHVGSTWLFNKNISDDGAKQDYAAGWGFNYGVGATVFFNKRVGLGLDLLLSKHTGAYTGDMDSLGTYDSWATLNSFNIPILFKLKNDAGGWIEIGPQYSAITNADFRYKHTISIGSSSITTDTTISADTSYAKSNISMVFGLGINIKFTDRIGLKTGFRFEYGLADLKGLDGMGRDLKNSFFYPTYEKTNSATGSFMLGLYIKLGDEDE